MKKTEYLQQDAFLEHSRELWKKVGSHGIMTLATCAENRVTARVMSVIVYNGKFYCQTDENFLKYKQITKNPNVALCYKNYSIEGVCRCIGKPLDEKNIFFAKAFKKHFFASYKAYSALKTECLLEITPTLIYVWEYEFMKPYMEYWDFTNKEYKREDK